LIEYIKLVGCLSAVLLKALFSLAYFGRSDVGGAYNGALTVAASVARKRLKNLTSKYLINT